MAGEVKLRRCPACGVSMREVFPLRNDLREKGVTFVTHDIDPREKSDCWMRGYMPTPQEWNRRAIQPGVLEVVKEMEEEVGRGNERGYNRMVWADEVEKWAARIRAEFSDV